MGTGAAAFLVGRDSSKLPPTEDVSEDRLFAAIRIDELTVSGKTFRHCTFANISFKDATVSDCEFLHCAFLNCYFRRAELLNSSFVGSKFYECDFPKTTIQGCDFRYAKFHDCVIPIGEMEHNLPPEPNLRDELATILALAADGLEQSRQARAYRLIAIRARQEHLWSAALAKSTWYREHYPALDRVGAFLRFLGSKTNGLIWGHGQRWGVLLRNLVILTFLIFPLLLSLVRDSLRIDGSSISAFPELIWLSLGAILPVPGIVTPIATSFTARILLAAEAFTGIVIAGLFVTLLFRTVSRR